MDNTTLYHYCSIETFVSILESNKLKFSDITKSNDREEILFLWKKYIEYFSNNSTSMAMAKYDVDNQLENTDFLVACFSEKKDSLHMWTSYANGGVAIGFCKSKLQNWCKHMMILNNAVAISDSEISDEIACLDKVIYYNKEKVAEYVKEKCELQDYAVNAFGDIFRDAPFSKTDFWEEEAEWRISIPLIYSSPIDLSGISDEVSIPPRLDMHYCQNKLSGMSLSSFVPFSKDFIESITLAPNCKMSKIDVIKAISIYGFEPEKISIEYSNGSLR